MNTKLTLIFILVAGISSCTTIYKSGQTPDDVYYSPAIPQNDYVNVTAEEDNIYYSSSEEDRAIRRRINNRRLRVYNDYDYYSYPYAYNYPYTYNPYTYNYPYSHSYYAPIYINPTTGKAPSIYTGPRKFNLSSYGNTANNNVIYQPNSKTGSYKPGVVPVRTLSNSTANPATNNSTGVGNFIRRVFTSPSGNTNSYNTIDNSSQNRTYQPVRNSSPTTITNSSSGSTSSSSNVPVRTFRK